MTPLPHPPYSAQQLSFVSPMRKVLKGKRCGSGRGETNNNNNKKAEALKGIKIDKFKPFEQWEKCLNRCVASNGKYFEGD